MRRNGQPSFERIFLINQFSWRRAPLKAKKLLNELWKQRSLQAFALIGMAFIFVFCYLPMFGILMAFKNYNITTGVIGIITSKWVGFKYFLQFFNDYKFGTLVYNTLIISFTKLIFTFPLPIILALILNEVKNKPIKRVVQTASYLPYFISWVIVSGFCQIFLTQSGVVNSILINLKIISAPVPFLTSSSLFLPLAILSACWKDMGWWAIIFLAAIAGIDPSLYEAAEIDGASRIGRIRHITLPGMSGTITIVLILALGNLLGGGLSGSNFEQCYLLGNPGNIDASDIIQTYVMRVGLSNGRYPYAAAAGLLQSVISVIMIYSSNLVSRKISGQSLF
jgi:putative aldouronate transport system permease protein